MKKIFKSAIASALLVTGLSAASIDTSSLELNFEGYKTSEMAGTVGTFKNIKYTFGKDGSSITGVFKGATATIKPQNVDMGDDTITNNMKNAFFANFTKSDIKVSVVDVLEGENTGLITVKVSIGKESALVPLTYTIKDGKFEAKGQLALSAFKNAHKALTALSKAAAGHKNMSWPLVDIMLEANAK